MRGANMTIGSSSKRQICWNVTVLFGFSVNFAMQGGSQLGCVVERETTRFSSSFTSYRVKGLPATEISSELIESPWLGVCHGSPYDDPLPSHFIG